MSEAQILAGVNQSGKPKLTVAEVGPAIVDLMKKVRRIDRLGELER
jgi:hypothetical protein